MFRLEIASAGERAHWRAKAKRASGLFKVRRSQQHQFAVLQIFAYLVEGLNRPSCLEAGFSCGSVAVFAAIVCDGSGGAHGDPTTAALAERLRPNRARLVVPAAAGKA